MRPRLQSQCINLSDYEVDQNFQRQCNKAVIIYGMNSVRLVVNDHLLTGSHSREVQNELIKTDSLSRLKNQNSANWGLRDVLDPLCFFTRAQVTLTLSDSSAPPPSPDCG